MTQRTWKPADKLPKPLTTVLVVALDEYGAQYQTLGYYDPALHEWRTKGWWSTIKNPTHWMAMPPMPPKNERETNV